MPNPKPLAPSDLRRVCDGAQLPFATTAELEPLDRPLGQDRAVEAARFAVALRRPGYNLFVLGPSGYGKHAFVRQILDQAAASREVPPDICSRSPCPRAVVASWSRTCRS
jgi:hypothetical protein